MPTITSTLGALAALAIKLAAAKDWDSPAYNYLYQYPLPIPPVKKPLTTVDFPDGPSIEYYEIEIKPFEQQVYPNLGKTRLVGYDGIAPGPTFMMRKGTEAVVRFINHADRANSVHLHGSYSRAPFDGWAEDTTDVNSYKDYYYPNGQNARTLWYHDHAIDHTAENAYMGQAGMYILHDTEEEAVKGLPQGKDYDIPLVLASKRYNPDGTLWSPEANHETTNLFGDVIHVNGQPWPYLKVEPRKYRFRLLDASISRSFQLYLEQATKVGTRLNFKVVGSDAGILLTPVDTTQLDISMAERYEIVIDFSPYKNSNVTMRSNKKVADNTDYIHTDKIMQFVVGDTISDPNYKAEDLPAKLRDVPFPPAHAGIEHQFEFQRTGGEWKINGVDWADGPEKRILAKPPRGAVENWVLKNGAGGWTHPVHIHLVDFQVVARTGGSRGGVQPYEKVALKDVVWLNTNEQVNVIARYAPWDGVYMFHCHNLIHEDNEMMAAFNVSALSDLGYDEKTSFIDPMETRYRAKHFSDSDLTSRSGDFSDDSIKAKIGFFHALEGYKNAGTVEEKLVEYWSTHTSGAASATSSATTLITRVSSATGSTTPSAAAAAASSGASKASGSKSDDTVASSTGSSAAASATA